MAGTELTLVVPGLLAADAMGRPREVLEGLALDKLDRLLGRAETRARAESDLESVLFALFGVPLERGEEPAVAPLTLWHDSGQAPDGWWLRADPLTVRPTQDRLIMVGGGTLSLEAGEAGTLCAELNAHFSDAGWRLISPVPDRWYLPMTAPPRARFVSLPKVVGGDIHPHLPRGPEGRNWRSMLNEAQMVLHASEVNRRRAAAGRSEVNTLWFWGAGTLPAPPPAGTGAPWARVWAGGPLAAGLAAWGGIPQAPAPVNATCWLEDACDGGSHLIVLDDLREPASLCAIEAWRAGVQALHDAWFAPLYQALKGRRLTSLDIVVVDDYSASGAGGAGERRVSRRGAVDYHVTRKLLRRWWRRRAMRPADVRR